MQSVHFIGIEGIGTSAAAQILLSRGHKVSGSDLSPGDLSHRLYKNGAVIYRGHAGENLSEDVDTVIASAAISDDNPELQEAKKRGIEICYYSQLLGRLMAQKIGIAVSGTHGKTTTSGMLAYVLQEAQLDPSFVIGGNISQLQGNGRAGKGEHFVAESCEYKRSFLNLTPKMGIITNIEADHLDYYKNIEEIHQVFTEFAQLIPQQGVLVAEKDAADCLGKTTCQVITYSLDKEADWTAEVIDQNSLGNRFVVYKHGEIYGVFDNAIPGRHNVSNSLAVIAMADSLGVPFVAIQEALSKYQGAMRRFDVLQELPFTVIDDYAHHPTEIKAVVAATKERFPESRLWCVFQPHQASRTYHFLQDFAKSFEGAKEVIIPNIYYARDTEEDRRRVSSADLVTAIRSQGITARYIAQFDKVEDFLLARCQKGDVVLCMGAGSINQLSKSLVGKPLIDFGRTERLSEVEIYVK